MKNELVDIQKMTDEELTVMLTDIRLRRKQGYTIRKKAISAKSDIPILESLEGIDDDIAMKILDELLAEDT